MISLQLVFLRSCGCGVASWSSGGDEAESRSEYEISFDGSTVQDILARRRISPFHFRVEK